MSAAQFLEASAGVIGVVLLAAVAIDAWLARREERRLRESPRQLTPRGRR